MHLQLTLQHEANVVIPINYQFELSSAIYKLFAEVNTELSKWFEKHNFSIADIENKQFDFFSFSRIDARPFELDKIHLVFRMLGNQSFVTISFYADDIEEQELINLFINKEFTIVSGRTKPVKFLIQDAKMLPDPIFNPTMRFEALSPVILSQLVKGRETPLYTHPTDKIYPEKFIQNLLNRYAEACKHDLAPTPLNQLKLREPINFKILGDAKKKKVVIKNEKNEEIDVYGFEYRFDLTAPIELLEMGYQCGFGEKTNIGFGFVRAIKF